MTFDEWWGAQHKQDLPLFAAHAQAAWNAALEEAAKAIDSYDRDDAAKAAMIRAMKSPL